MTTAQISATLSTARVAAGQAHPIIAVAELVGRDGVEAHHDAVVAAVTSSALVTTFPVLAQIAIDATAPPVARERAVGRLAAVATTQIAPPRTGRTVVWEARAA